MAETSFHSFLECSSDWAIRISTASGQSVLARDIETFTCIIKERPRGTFDVVLYRGGIEQGRATISKLISYRLKEESATRACIGIAHYYNNSL